MNISEKLRSCIPFSLQKPLRQALYGYYSIRVKLHRVLHKENLLHIVICGYPRSGTSLLQNMLSATTNGFSYDSFETRAAQRIHRPGNYITKMPMDIFSIEEVISNNVHRKDILVIVVIRDIRDVLTSKHPLLPDRYFIDYENSWWPQDAAFTTWRKDAPGIKDIHGKIVDVMRLRDEYLNTMIVKYEELVNDPDKLQMELAQRYPINCTTAFSEFHRNKKRLAYRYEGRHQAKDSNLVFENRSVQTSRIAKWKNVENLEALKQEFERHPELFDILIDYGYEEDRGWFTKLSQ